MIRFTVQYSKRAALLNSLTVSGVAEEGHSRAVHAE